MNRNLIAAVAHEINRAYCAATGGDSQPAWADAPEWQQQSILAGVDMHLANPDATPEQSHESWLAQKIADGWTYGEVKNVKKKRHPCCVPYSELPTEQKAKDYLFRATVHALKEYPETVERVVVQERGASGTPTHYRAVRYIGRRDSWRDRHYGSNLSFEQNQVRSIPPEMAKKFLRHSDIFEEAVGETVQDPATVDDTESTLADANAKQVEERDKQNEIYAVFDQINQMDEDMLKEYAFARYQQSIPKTLSLENMRKQVTQMVEQYGVV